MREAAGFGGSSGVLGTVVMAQTEGGTILRARPEGSRKRSPGQTAQGGRLARVKRAWDALSDADAAAWRAFALGLAAARPLGDRGRLASAYAVFSGLGSKWLQLHGGGDVPARPPVGPFLGDAVGVTVAAGSGSLTFGADRANRAGTVTELLAQRLSGRHGATRPRSYTSLGFVAFAAGGNVSVPVPTFGTWACAVRFVEASSGRMTEVVEIGRAGVGLSAGTATG